MKQVSNKGTRLATREVGPCTHTPRVNPRRRHDLTPSDFNASVWRPVGATTSPPDVNASVWRPRAWALLFAVRSYVRCLLARAVCYLVLYGDKLLCRSSAIAPSPQQARYLAYL